MKKIIFTSISVIVFAASMYSLGYLGQKQNAYGSEHPSQGTDLLKTKVNSSITKKDSLVDLCPPLSSVYEKMTSLKGEQKTSQGKDINEKSHNLMMSLSQDINFKNLEKVGLENNDCGASATSFLIDAYKEINLTKKAEEAHQRLSKFASTNNKTAIKLLCFSESSLSTASEKSHFCEFILNSDDSAYDKSKNLALILLKGIYQKTKEVDKLADICEKNSDYKKKKGCYFHLYLLGRNLFYDKKYQKALEAFKKAADYDDEGFSQSNIANIYQNGLGTEKSLALAIYWHNEALMKIDDKSFRAEELNDTGVAYDQYGNYVEAFLYFKKSAEMGCPLGQLNLAKMYVYGRGVIQDNKEAFAWLSVAMAVGLQDTSEQEAAKHIKNYLLFILSVSERNEAIALSKNYYKKYVLNNTDSRNK